MPSVLVGTETGLLTIDPDGGHRHSELEGRDVRAMAPASWKQLWAAVDGQEIWRRDGARSEWRRIASLADLPEAGLQAQCLADTRVNAEAGILVGTSRAHLARVTAERVALVESFERAPSRSDWYTPWGGPPAVRSLTENRGSVLVNVHVGGVLRTRDRGASWEPTVDIYEDIHRVVTKEAGVYAAGGRGLSVSPDGGETWTLAARGLEGRYCRSVTVCGEAVLVSSSDGPRGGRAAVYRTDLEARSFERCRQGLPQWFEGNIDSLSLDSLPDGSLAAFASESGEVFVSLDQGSGWSMVGEGLPAIRCVLVWP